MAKKENKIRIQQVRSIVGVPKDQVKVVRALGLTKKNQIVEHNASATIMGMVNKVNHIVSIVE